MSKAGLNLLTAITFYRIATAPLLLLLLWRHELGWFKWLLAVSFFTDAIDGFFARKYNITSIAGARLDSIGDDLTVLVAIVGMLVLKWDFVLREKVILLILCGLFIIQTTLALARYGKQSSFHTLLAKAAAILQAAFLLSLFFLPHPLYLIFYSMAIITALDLVEEAILVILLPRWQADVKGICWIKRDQVQSGR
ncbi:MAG TPA: CDP-alcohol phosphatidyltransferase family protein [Puia sp.]|uniref:CDP-alcohol phosphatidyltransferase family protein n=1 Tax=Puia sp. TaxID=2045100 RepID=UPI002BA1C5FD|nr:CDP-alcohol phosphatidyltransferase family protein [Puia sp.]HVU94155.1 CDP-alcohol phosphatidyltransferase family protein [Puia sp.]